MLQEGMRLDVMCSDRLLRDKEDWAELCLCSKGRAMNLDITPTQFDVIAMALGLSDIEGEPDSYVKLSDRQLREKVLPVLEENIERFWAGGDACTIAETS